MRTLAVSRHSAPFFRTNWHWLVLIVTLVTLCWCFAYHRWTAQDWSTPLGYGGDGWSVLAAAKALATGEIWPLLPKNPASLGAPFIANWNDYPSVEEGFLAWWAIFVRIFGVFLGTNLTMLSAHLLAAVSFYFVCWQLNYSRVFSAAGAVLFALSRYSFARGLDHMVLAFYWHVPLGLLVAWWCLSDSPLVAQRKKLLFAFVVAVLNGVQNPYYTWFFCQLMAFAALYQWIRRKNARLILSPLLVAGVAGATFLLMNIDTFYFRWINGPPAAVTVIRDYAGLEHYALKPIELLVPPVHSIRALESWAHRVYFERAFVRGEVGAAYLGIVGILSLALLIWSVMRSVASAQLKELPSHFWGLVIIFAYSVVGGLNGVIGLFGIVLFRCSNRYSIAILAIALLFFVRQLTSISRAWRTEWAVLLACVLVAVGLFDQLPPRRTAAEISSIRERVISDSRMVADIEQQVPPGAMVFELPIMDYPEVPPIRELADYEEFRPYLHSRHLRFSYGSNKGRYRERWQREAEQMGVAEMVRLLEKYGFSAILINRKGYEDKGESLVSSLRMAGKSGILTQTSEFVAVALTPSEHPVLPPEFGAGWSGLEGDSRHNWRWSTGDARLTIYNLEKTERSVNLRFRLETLKSRHLVISTRAAGVYADTLTAGAEPTPVTITLQLSPGRNDLQFRTDVPGQPPGTGDQRKLAYALHDFEISGL